MSQATDRIRNTLFALAGASLVFSVAVLMVQDKGTLTQAKALSERLDKADRERLESLAAEESLKTLQPLAILAAGRRDEFIASVQQAAASPGSC